MNLVMRLTLLSDATFGRGDGLAGLVDAEVEHDEHGLPFLRGRTLKGLLVEECANILFALKQNGHAKLPDWETAASWLFGRPGSTGDDVARMRVGDGVLPDALRRAVAIAEAEGKLRADDVLESLTVIRRQSAVDEKTGAPDAGSLRSMRVVLRQTTFHASLTFADPANDTAKALLAACILSLRRGGTGRNRGRGKLYARLYEGGKDVTDIAVEPFYAALEGGVR